MTIQSRSPESRFFNWLILSMRFDAIFSDQSPAEASFELGFSGAHGYNDKKNKYASTLAGIDVTYKWVPAGRSHYRTTEFRSEFFLSHRETATDELDRFGFYSYVTNKIGPRFWVGLRYSYSELPRDIENKSEWDISPTIDLNCSNC